ncbi:YheC/YheD family protein [Neobacillus sp. PS3-40]|uniref:YheC/YheD family endospore coat-associated protein n=1 Tax=Neobacillus sp. PS3-40 TaxID=3070679 RepID=UPI0027E1CCF8|nr:YheC/YheD family protein [Neobacillus sp. PS3-40]WML43277.1 YheC/YheD family protein [Neobacillus sp. PS3-40]
MKLFYDSTSANWYHTNYETVITMGGEKEIISKQQKGNLEDTSFNLKIKNKHIGPLIGIMSARKRDGTIAGNGPLFRELQKKLISYHGISFIFTPDGVKDNFISGYIYLPDRDNWMKVKLPFPDLVYNRVPFRKLEQDKDYCSVLLKLKEKNILFFNPCFIDKYTLYLLLQNHPILQEFLPNTEVIHKQTNFQAFLEKYQSVYLKPTQSARGKGIFRLKLLNQSEIHLEGLSSREIYPTPLSFWREWESVLIEENYIVQEEIHSAEYDGKRFDFRILAHAESEGYQVTGIGIRQSQGQGLTTHLSNGGELLSYELLRSNEHDQFIKTVVDHIGRTLTEQIGFFGEFSIDAGISVAGKYYIYEVNSKPMSFDEEEIEKRKITQLCRLFLKLTDFLE